MASTNSYGDPATNYVHSVVTVNSSANAVALAANVDRKFAIFVNDGTTPMYLTEATSTGTATASQGIRINGNGGSYEVSPKAGNLSVRTYHAMTAASTGHKLLVTTNAT